MKIVIELNTDQPTDTWLRFAANAIYVVYHGLINTCKWYKNGKFECDLHNWDYNSK